MFGKHRRFRAATRIRIPLINATQRNDPQRWQERGIKIAGRLITFSTHCSFRRGGIDRVRTQSHASALFVNRVNDSRQHGTLIVPGSTMEATDRRCTPKNWKNRAGRGLKGRKRKKGKKKPIARLIESADVTRWYFPSSIRQRSRRKTLKRFRFGGSFSFFNIFVRNIFRYIYRMVTREKYILHGWKMFFPILSRWWASEMVTSTRSINIFVLDFSSFFNLG